MIKNHIIFNDATDWIFDFNKAKECFVWTKEGKRLIDFTSAWNVTNLGWNNPELVQVIKKQANINTQTVLWAGEETQIKYSKTLTSALPKNLNTIARTTGGTEANEMALKTARAFTGRKKIIGFKDTYHGESFGAMAIGYRPEYVELIAPLVPNFVQINFPKVLKIENEKQTLSKFKTLLEGILKNEDVAAIVTEAGIITGWGSTFVAPNGYLKIVRDLTKKYGTLLILDEVGTGFSRCGRLFGMELENVTPDIVTFAKAQTNGSVTMGTMVTTEQIANKTLGKNNLTSTLGWSPVACVAALKTLEIHQRDQVWKKAEKDGNYIINVLKKKLKDNPAVTEVRGKGMEIGLELKDSLTAQLVVKKAFEKGLHLIVGDGGNIQIMPPLIIKRELLDEGLDILFKLIDSVV